MDQRDASATKNQDITHWINDQLSGHCYQFTNFYPFPPPLPSTPHYFIRNWIKGNNVKAMQEFAFPSLLPLRFSSPSCPSCLLKFDQNYEVCSKFLVIHLQTPLTGRTDLCKRDGGNLIRCHIIFSRPGQVVSMSQYIIIMIELQTEECIKVLGWKSSTFLSRDFTRQKANSINVDVGTWIIWHFKN